MSVPLALRTDDLVKRYGGAAVLDGVDLRVARGTITGFLGPNGAGKTTTLKSILGLVRPDAGRIRLFGEDVATAGPALRSRVGWLAQEPRVHGHLTAREALRHALRLSRRTADDEAAERVEASLELVGLSDRADRTVRGFSGGERQRLGLAQAWIHRPELLILDEPAASLDPMGRRDVLRILERLRAETTILFSTHLLDDVERVADAVAILDRGRLRLQCSMDELRASTRGATYHLVVQGAAMARLARLAELPWIERVVTERNGTELDVRVHVRDERKAETELLAALTEGGDVRVRSFALERPRLEDVFVHLTEGNAA